MRRKEFRGFCLNGCGNEVFSRNPKAKYCSLSCSNLRFKKRRSLNLCASCGKPVSRAAAKYCSGICQRTYQFNIRANALERGDYKAYSCNRFIRKYLVSKFGERCSRCGWCERHPRTARVPVEVEHIDGNWQNNRLDNLTLLCPNCHSLTDTFRGLNRGRGRAYRLGGRMNPLSMQPALGKKQSRKRISSPPRPGQDSGWRQLTLLAPT